MHRVGSEPASKGKEERRKEQERKFPQAQEVPGRLLCPGVQKKEALGFVKIKIIIEIK